jgi:hypothetical protein
MMFLPKSLSELGSASSSIRYFAQLLPVEDVYAHGGQVAFRVLGLFLKFGDIAVVSHVHYAEAGGLLHGYLQHGDGAGGARLMCSAA